MSTLEYIWLCTLFWMLDGSYDSTLLTLLRHMQRHKTTLYEIIPSNTGHILQIEQKYKILEVTNS